MVRGRRAHDDEFTTVEADGRVFLIRCRKEPEQGGFRHSSYSGMWRTFTDRRRWNVDLDSADRNFGLVRESYDSEAQARGRVAQLEAQLAEGTFEHPRRPAIMRVHCKALY